MKDFEKITSKVTLLPGEKLVSIESHDPRSFDNVPSSLEQILRLTKSKSPEAIGEHGPSIASLALDLSSEGDSQTPDHLKLYEVVFGRDSLRVAIDLISSYPKLARATTYKLAELQGTTQNREREEEPGRIVHEARDQDDVIAKKLSQELGWGWPYYGSVDSTPEFIRTLSAYCRLTEENNAFLSAEYTNKDGETHSMAYAMDMAVDWITTRIDKSPSGMLEFKSVLPKGIENQVWKDSWDAYHHADGSLANHKQGIASVEVQTTTYDALMDAANLYEHVLDNRLKADQLRKKADDLKSTILSKLWTDERGGYFVLGTDYDDDGNLRQMKIKTSNMGHVLNSRLLEDGTPENDKKIQATVSQIISPEMLATSGIRTLASDEKRFRPGAYHNGSIWLWDTHHIAKGLRRQGFTDIADNLDSRVLNVVDSTKMFPEYVRGDNSVLPSVNTETIVLWDDNFKRENKLEQPPQEVQAWTVAAIEAIKQRLKRRQKQS
ncbi:MAG: hypothetical protein L0H36_03230 [bacterium]|nr:hypothetical protein [bacterium]MDN5835624.1 hypothetical protein [bacterium]